MSSSSSSWFSSALSSGLRPLPPLLPFLRPLLLPLPTRWGFRFLPRSGLGLSDEYQALGRWYFASGGADFPAYLSAHFPHLYSDFRLDFSFGSSRFLLALSSAPTPPVSGPSASLPSSSFLSHSFAVSSSAGLPSLPHFPSSAFPFSVRPGVPVSSSPPLALLAHPLGFFTLAVFFLSCSPSFFSSSGVFRWGFGTFGGSFCSSFFFSFLSSFRLRSLCYAFWLFHSSSSFPALGCSCLFFFVLVLFCPSFC